MLRAAQNEGCVYAQTQLRTQFNKKLLFVHSANENN